MEDNWRYFVERDLFMSKLEAFLNKKLEEGFDLVDVFVSEQDERQGRNGQNHQASKVTVIMKGPADKAEIFETGWDSF